jgi:hypothetical protein
MVLGKSPSFTHCLVLVPQVFSAQDTVDVASHENAKLHCVKSRVVKCDRQAKMQNAPIARHEFQLDGQRSRVRYE